MSSDGASADQHESADKHESAVEALTYFLGGKTQHDVDRAHGFAEGVLEPPQRTWNRKRDSIIADERRDSFESITIPALDLDAIAREQTESEPDLNEWVAVFLGEDGELLNGAILNKCMRGWNGWATYMKKIEYTVDRQRATAEMVRARNALLAWQQVARLPVPRHEPPRSDGYGGVAVPRPRDVADTLSGGTQLADQQSRARGSVVARPKCETGVPLANLDRLTAISRIGRETRASSVLSMLSVHATVLVYPIYIAWFSYVQLVVSFEEQLAKEFVSAGAAKYTESIYSAGYREMYSGRRWRRQVMQVWRPRMLMKRMFGRWVRVMQLDWPSTCEKNCTHYFSFQMVFKLEHYRHHILKMKILGKWRQVSWLDARRRQLDRDREEMRASYSLRRWTKHEESLSPPQRRRIINRSSPSRSPSPRKRRVQPACWLPPPPPPDDEVEESDEDVDEVERAANTGPRYSFEYRRRPSTIELQL